MQQQWTTSSSRRCRHCVIRPPSLTPVPKKVEDEMTEAGLIPPPPPAQTKVKRDAQRDSFGTVFSATGDEEEGVRARFEAIGYHVGANITEKLCHDRTTFPDTLDIIKFICKDLWLVCWDKQVDNLRTNHRGVYVLQDNSFKPIARISSWESRADATKRARVYVAMPTGIIRGALMRLGLHGTVTPETNLPQCTFQVKIPRSL